MIEFEKIRYDLARHIGYDIAVISADDEAAHLDPVSVIFSLAGLAIVSYCAGFIEAVAKDSGRKAWHLLRGKVEKALKRGPQEILTKDQEEIENRVLVVFTETVVTLREERLEITLQSGFEAAKQRATSYLEAQRFSKQKASELVERLEKLMHEGHSK